MTTAVQDRRPLFPSSSRRGVRDINKWPRSEVADGVVDQLRSFKTPKHHLLATILCVSRCRAYAPRPSAPAKELRTVLLMSQPPLLEEEGNRPRLYVSEAILDTSGYRPPLQLLGPVCLARNLSDRHGRNGHPDVGLHVTLDRRF